MLFELRQVVADVVYEMHLEVLGRTPQDGLERRADSVHQHLPVGKREVATRVHSSPVALGKFVAEWYARKLTVGWVVSERVAEPVDGTQIVGARLVAQTARTGMDHHAHLIFVEPQQPGRGPIADVVHDLNFEKVVARSQTAELTLPPLLGALRHL